MHVAGTSVTGMLLIARLSSSEVAANLRAALDMTPAQFVARLGAAATTLATVPDCAKTIREFATRRRLHEASAIMRDALTDPMQDMRAAASVCSAAIEQGLNAGHKPKASVRDIIATSLAALAEDAVSPGVQTGLREVDRMLGGFVRGDLIVLGARPSMGKSALSISTSLSSARMSYRLEQESAGEPWSTLFLTHEMMPEQVIQRMLTDLAYDLPNGGEPVEYSRFRPPPGERQQPLNEKQRQSMERAAAFLPHLPIIVDGRPGMRISEVTALIRSHKRRCARRGAPLRTVVCDHIGLGKILPDFSGRDSRVDEIGHITSALKATAVNEDLCVLACHQLSRATEGRDNKRPTLADFRDSGHIEQDADVMLGLYREAYYAERTKETDADKEAIRQQVMREKIADMELYVLKQRSGKVGVVSLYAHMGANAVRDKFLNG